MFSDEIRSYVRAEEDVTPLIDAAEKYLENSGIKKDEGNELYALAVKMLVSYWYDNRLPAGKMDVQPYGLGGIILQLQMGGESDAGGGTEGTG